MSVTQSKLFNRFWRVAGAVSVRTKILGIVLWLVLLLGVGITVQVRIVMHDALADRTESQGVSIARDLAARTTDLILINDLYALHELLAETLTNNPDVRYAFILNADGEILAQTFGDGFPKGLLTANDVDPQGHHHATLLETDEGEVWDTAVPIFGGKAGVARVGMSETSVYNTLVAITSQMLLTTVVVSAVGIAAATLLTWIVTRPILELKRSAQAVGHGNFSQQIQPWANDEIGELAKAFNRMTADLAQADRERAEREQIRQQLLERVITAQEEERKRIARELHDETGQSLTSLMVRLKMMGEQSPTPEFADQITELRQIVGETLTDVHNLSVELRPSALDDLGLAAALKRYVQECCQRYQIEIDLVAIGLEERLPASVETALYRIIQEGLTNIARHAEATSASILIERRNGRVRAIIEDDGKGFDVKQLLASGRLGLHGMRERAELLDGALVIESTPGQGTSIFIEAPV